VTAGGVGVRTSCVCWRVLGRLVGRDVWRDDAAARPVERALLAPLVLRRVPFVRVAACAALRAGLVAGLVDLR
jgi:hypothetical protein